MNPIFLLPFLDLKNMCNPKSNVAGLTAVDLVPLKYIYILIQKYIYIYYIFDKITYYIYISGGTGEIAMCVKAHGEPVAGA